MRQRLRKWKYLSNVQSNLVFMKKIFLFLFLFISLHAFSIDFYGVYPTHWWVTMNYPGVTVNKLTKVDSKNYLIVDITISSTAKPGNFKIFMSGGGLPNDDV